MMFVVATSSKFDVIKVYFEDTEWQDISDYEKNNYLCQWENWRRMCDIGFVSPAPRFTNAGNFDERPEKTRERKVRGKEDGDWLPEVDMKLASQRKSTVCVKCQSKFFSERAFKKHERTCVVSDQGITGRHLKRMSDSDLQEMGINKASRMDIGDIVGELNEHSNRPHAVNQSETNYTANSNINTDLFENLVANEVNNTSSTPIRGESANVGYVRNYDITLGINQDLASCSQPCSQTLTSGTSTDLASSAANFQFVAQASPESSRILISQNETSSTESSRSVMQNQTPLATSVLRFGGGGPSTPLSQMRTPLSHFSFSSHNKENLEPQVRNTPTPSICARNPGNFAGNSVRPISQIRDSSSPICIQPFPLSSSSVAGTPSMPADLSSAPSNSAGTSFCLSSEQRVSSSLIQPRLPSLRSATVTPSTSSDLSSAQCSSSSTRTPGDLNSEGRILKLLQDAANSLKFGYNINEILPKYRGGDNILKTLQKDGFVSERTRKVMCNILINHINLNPMLSASPVAMREEMAVSVLVAYPKMAKKLLKPSDRPWDHWFNIHSNTGFLQNVNASCQRLNKKITGEGQRRSKKAPREPRKLVELPSNNLDNNVDDPDPVDFLRNVTELKNLMPNSAEKANILHLMAQTFERRRYHLDFKELETTKLFLQYPHFLSYQGEVIEQEFARLFPGKSSLFLRSFSIDFVPKLMKIAKEKPEKYENWDHFGDELLNSLIILGKLLPTPRRSYAHEARQPLHPHVSDLFHMIPLGSNPSVEAGIRRAQVNYPVQPHIMAIGAPRAIGKMFLVCGNSEMLELPRNASPTNAIDLLCKTYFAVNLHFPLGWKNVLRFLQVHLYEIPLENPRESSFDDTLVLLRNTSF